MSSIPASAIVNVTPSVIGAGGSALDLNGLMLTASTQVPIGDVHSFADAASVASYFGSGSAEAAAASIYFNGYDISTIKPGELLMAQYNASAVAAYTRGGSIASLTLAQLQALNGTLGIVMDGYTWPAVTVNFAAASSFSNAASIAQSAMIASPPAIASVTGSITGTTLTVTAVGSGVLAVGQTITGSGISASTRITVFGTGTGGTGTYTVNNSQSAGSTTITASATPFTITYNSTSGAFVATSGITGVASTAAFMTGTLSTSVKMTSATGAVTSQGAAAAVPGTFMDGIAANSQNWAAFQTLFNPDVSGNANKLLFAIWANAQNNRYVYVCSDSDITATNTNPATTSLGYLLKASNYSGTCLIYEPTGFAIANFILGAIASADFTRNNGRITFAFKKQSGLSATASTSTEATNLLANNYNFYGSYATASETFIFFNPGSISGAFLWLDSFINQVWMNSNFQLALMNLLVSANSIPYNAAGYALIESALLDPINAAVTYGAIRPGVTLSEAQKAQVNNAASVDIAPILNTRGWYLQVSDASPAVRAARGSPPCSFWYMDGQAVQKINLASIELQ